MMTKITVCGEFDVDQFASLIVPIASIHAFATQDVPAGYLICDGSAVSRSAYAELFEALGIVWGEGDGNTTFNIPDLRGEFLRGFDAGRGVDVGRVFASWQEDELKSHTHTYLDSRQGGTADRIDTTNDNFGQRESETDPTGGYETRPRNVAVTYAIKATSS